MLSISFLPHNKLPRFFLFISCLLILTNTCFAQYQEKSDGELFQLVKDGIDGSLVELRPVLLEVNKRLEGKPEQDTYTFLIGLSYQDEFTEKQDKALLKKATEYYRTYIKKFPTGTRREFVRFNLAGAEAELDNFKGAVENYDWLFRRSENKSLRAEARDRMCALYIKHNKAAEGLPLFKEVFNQSLLDDELRARSASWVLQGYLANNQPKEIIPYLRYLTGRYEAIYDPKFNITLLKSGDSLFDKELYDQAILLYSFVKSRESIIDFYQDLVRSLEKKVQYTPTDSEQFAIVDGRLKAAEANLNAVRDIRSYDVDMRWRVARVYLKTKRTWEALWAFYHLYQDYPDHQQVEDFLYITFGEAQKVGEDVLVKELAEEYLKRPTYTKYRDQITLGLSGYYNANGQNDALQELADTYLITANSPKVAAQMINFKAGHFIDNEEYFKLRDLAFQNMNRFEGKEPVFETCRYWYGFSNLLLAEYVIAAETFEAFLDAYTRRSAYYEDISYRYAIAIYGLQDYAAAEAQFLKFTEMYPNSSLRGEAELYIGDLMRDRGAFSEAVEHYQMVEQHTDNSAFIAKAIFAVSEVYDAAGQSDAAVELLRGYVERYGKKGDLADAYYRMGMIRDRQRREDERFALHAFGIQQIANDVKRYAVDELITNYIKDYETYQKTYAASLSLLDRLLTEDSFRRKFLKDRGMQYRFMRSEEGEFVDQDLSYRLIRDRDFRALIIENTDQAEAAAAKKRPIVTAEMAKKRLNVLRDFYQSKADALEEYSSEVLFTSLYETSVAENQRIMEMRSRMALDLLGAPVSATPYTLADLRGAPPVVLLWAAEKRSGYNQEEATTLYKQVLSQHPYSNSIYDAYTGLAKLSLDKAEKTDSPADWQQALDYYNIISERFAMRETSALPTLKRGRIIGELGNTEEAIDVLSGVLRNPMWGGIQHAEAHLEIGKLYMELDELDEAHAFFERIIVAYGGYIDVVTWAYYYDLLVLEEMGESESVQQLVTEIRSRRDALAASEEAFNLIDAKYDI